MTASEAQATGALKTVSGYGPVFAGTGWLKTSPEGIHYEVKRLFNREDGLFRWKDAFQLIVAYRHVYFYGSVMYSASGHGLSDSSGVAIDLQTNPQEARDLRAVASKFLDPAGWDGSSWWLSRATKKDSPVWCQESGCDKEAETKVVGVEHDCFVYEVTCWGDHHRVVRIPTDDRTLSGIWAGGDDARWVNYVQILAEVDTRGENLGIEWFGFLRAEDESYRTHDYWGGATDDESAPPLPGLKGFNWHSPQTGIPPRLAIGCAYGQSTPIKGELSVEIRLARHSPENRRYAPEEAANDFGYRLLATRSLDKSHAETQAGEEYVVRLTEVDLQAIAHEVPREEPYVRNVQWYYYKGPAVDFEARLLHNGRWVATRPLGGICLNAIA